MDIFPELLAALRRAKSKSNTKASEQPPSIDPAARKARLQELRSDPTLDALRFRFWFEGRDGKTLMQWRDIIDTQLNAPKARQRGAAQ